MEEEVGFGLTRSRITAISRFANEILSQTQNASASARSRNPQKLGFSPSTHKIKTGLKKSARFY